MRLKSTAAFLALLLSGSANAATFAQMFTQHAVLQRDKPIPVWGEAAPGSTVTVSLGDRKVTAKASAAGAWSASLPAMKAGGPYRLSARTEDGSEQVLEDVMVGDVFLCSGQSNMEWPLKSADNGEAEVARINDASIRLLSFPQIVSPVPLDRFQAPVAWEVASPATTGEFSAVCLYMAEHLRRTTTVPFGLIDASWGGSAIQTWLSPAALKASGDPEMVGLINQFNRDPVAANAEWGRRWQDWWVKTVSPERPWADAFDASKWREAPAGLGNWEKWGVPELVPFNGMMWYRTTITLTPAQAAQGGTLDLGRADEVDQSWINGLPVGNSSSGERSYRIGKGQLKAGENVVLVNVLDTWGDGGLYGPHEKRALRLDDGTRIPLSGKWLYRAMLETKERPPRSPWDATAGQGMIYNAMMGPMRNYGIRAMAWYQGESNTSDGLARYQQELEALFADRRAMFGKDVSMLVVQLANYGKVSDAPVESGWADVREAQRRAVEADPAAGLAVIIDGPDPSNLHPTNKRDVGVRLGLAAENLVYGKRTPRAGPQPASATRKGDSVTIALRDVTGRLSAAHLRGFELCGDAKGSCRIATASLSGSAITLAGAGNATRVRYCWADAPVCAVRDAAVPLTPFEIAIR